MARPNAGDDSNPRSGEGGPHRTAAQFAADPAFTGTYARNGLPSHAPASSLLNVYDPRLNVYNWKASNTRKVRASLGKAQAGTGLAQHLFIGDSTTDSFTGAGSTSFDQANMWPRVYRSVLASLGIPSGGQGFVRAGGFSPTPDARWAFTGTWTNTTQYWATATVTSSTATLTTEACTTVDIWYWGSGSAFQYTIDGGSTQTITPNSANVWQKTALTGLSNTTHTIVITKPAGGNTIVKGVNSYGSSGLLVHNMAEYGRQSSDFVTFTDHLKASTIIEDCLPPATIDVVWCALGVNDLGASVAVSTVVANLTTLRARWASSDFILVGQYERQSLVGTGQWAAYVSALYTLADTLDVPLLDLYARSGGYTIANGNGLMGDVTHPAAAAQRDWGRNAALAAMA